VILHRGGEIRESLACRERPEHRHRLCGFAPCLRDHRHCRSGDGQRQERVKDTGQRDERSHRRGRVYHRAYDGPGGSADSHPKTNGDADADANSEACSDPSPNRAPCPNADAGPGSANPNPSACPREPSGRSPGRLLHTSRGNRRHVIWQAGGVHAGYRRAAEMEE
jgi:hypothetical protein